MRRVAEVDQGHQEVVCLEEEDSTRARDLMMALQEAGRRRGEEGVIGLEARLQEGGGDLGFRNIRGVRPTFSWSDTCQLCDQVPELSLMTMLTSTLS
jgi:hypothetical protein